MSMYTPAQKANLRKLNQELNAELAKLQTGQHTPARGGGSHATTPEVYLLLDTSYSMAGGKLAEAKKGAVSFQQKAAVSGYKTGLIHFQCEAELIVRPCRSAEKIRVGVARLQADGSTNLTEAFRLASSSFSPGKHKRIVVVLSDGCPNDPLSAKTEARSLQNKGVEIMVIPVEGAEMDFLKSIATIRGLEKAVQPRGIQQAMTATARLLPPPPPRRSIE